MVDMACFPGSSGSPIYIYNSCVYRDKNGSYFNSSSRLILLGFLYSGPIMNSRGVVYEIPTSTNLFSSTNVMINLGNYIKSSVLLDFEHIVESKLLNNNLS